MNEQNVSDWEPWETPDGEWEYTSGPICEFCGETLFVILASREWMDGSGIVEFLIACVNCYGETLEIDS